MCCLYCGKDIGTFRLLRDSEFCSLAHRKKYGERLTKTLHDIAAPEPPPASIASFLDQMPWQQGNRTPSLRLFQRLHLNGPRTPRLWTLTLDVSDPGISAGEPATRSAPSHPAMVDAWMRAPGADPAETFLHYSASTTPLPSWLAPRVAAELEAMPVIDQVRRFPALCHSMQPVPAAEPVAFFVQASACTELVMASHALQLPPVTMEVGPALDTEDTPAMCEDFQPSLAAEPVFSYLQASVAGTIKISCEVVLPVALDFLAVPHVPRIRQSQTAPFAEAVMAKVLPVAATAPMVLVRRSAAAMPAGPGQAAAQFEIPLGATAGARPEAIESLLDAAKCAIPISIQRAHRAATLTAPALFAPAPIAGGFVFGPEPAAVESKLAATVAGELPMARSIRVLPLVMTASVERGIPSLQALRVAPAIAPPAPAVPHQEAPQPVATVFVAQPAPPQAALDGHLPRHEIAPLEFHAARLRGEPVARPEWIATRIGLLPPRFVLPAALDKLEDPMVQPNPVKKAPEILNMPAAKRRPTVLIVAGRVAAAFLLASSLWYGVTSFRGDRRVNSEDLASSGPAIAPAPSGVNAAVTPGAPPAPPSKGAFSWMKETIAERASVKIAENFKSIDSWQGVDKAEPANWRRHSDGYINTGDLALFSPTLKFKDYRMEFFGQIESKSIGWTVRSKDPQNYHAMKLSVIEAGTRPFVALVQYNVVGGKAGRKTQTPLNIMVHNNRPMQFAVDVKGDRFVTSIDGEEVDSYVDSTLVAGGVGFFSDAGERARLYWLRVARNDDWLGHVCAMLADTVSTTATLCTPASPAGPLPGLPVGEDDVMLGAVWLGLPYLRASRKTQLTKSCRSEPWNS